MQPARPQTPPRPPGAIRRILADPVVRRTAAATLWLGVGGCASVGLVDPVRDDGSAGFAAACVGVLAAEKAATTNRAGGIFSVDGHRALNEWMFQASRRSSPFDDEMARVAERRRWAETLTDDGRARCVETCIKETGL